MIDLDYITNIRSHLVNQKKGYSLNDKKEFSIVRSTLIRNGLPTVCFDKNLGTLVIDEGKDKSKSIGYDNTRNMITGISYGFDLVHELFHMASKGENSFGFILPTRNGKKIGYSINEGITDYLTFISSNNKYEKKYPVESFVAYYLIQRYGRKILDYHLSARTSDIYKLFGEDRDEVISMIQSLDRFSIHRTEIIDSMNKGENNKLTTMLTIMYNDLVSSISSLLKIVSKSSEEDKNNCLEDFKKIFTSKSISNEFFDLISISSYKNYDSLFNEIEKNIENEFGRK